jgi:phage-related protein
MPATRVVLFAERDGSCPLLEWLDEIPSLARDKCVVRIERLAALGHEMRRPEADLLRDGIHELRARLGRVNYRILYFFHGRQAVVLSHGLTKERAVPSRDIDLALSRRAAHLNDPTKHTSPFWNIS